MRPLLKEGDNILVQNITPETLRVGDVVVFPCADKMIAHRFLGYQRTDQGKKLMVTKGDNLPYVDNPLCPTEFLLGKVIEIHRNDKIRAMDYPMRFFASQLIAGILKVEIELIEITDKVAQKIFRAQGKCKGITPRLLRMVQWPKKLLLLVLAR